jgi:hypothetical protein
VAWNSATASARPLASAFLVAACIRESGASPGRVAVLAAAPPVAGAFGSGTPVPSAVVPVATEDESAAAAALSREASAEPSDGVEVETDDAPVDPLVAAGAAVAALVEAPGFSVVPGTAMMGTYILPLSRTGDSKRRLLTNEKGLRERRRRRRRRVCSTSFGRRRYHRRVIRPRTLEADDNTARPFQPRAVPALTGDGERLKAEPLVHQRRPVSLGNHRRWLVCERAHRFAPEKIRRISDSEFRP